MDIPHSHHPDALLATLSDSEHFQLVANVFKQLGDPTRVRLFWLLCHDEDCVINLSAMMGMSAPLFLIICARCVTPVWSSPAVKERKSIIAPPIQSKASFCII